MCPQFFVSMITLNERSYYFPSSVQGLRGPEELAGPGRILSGLQTTVVRVLE